MVQARRAGRGARVAGAVLAGALLAGCAAAGRAEPGAAESPAAIRPDASGFSALAGQLAHSVVDIRTLRIGRDEAAEDQSPDLSPDFDFADRLAQPLATQVQVSQVRDLASGLVLREDGLILTSAHVVAGVDDVQVQLDDGRRFTARVLGLDRRTDVGLLKIETKGLPVALLGDPAGTRAGDWVAAISSPFGFHSSVTAGVVSAVGRFLNGAGEIPFIQTDVAINPGSSGSPLFNARGEVVGINSLIYSANGGYMGLSFAVPIDVAMRVVRQLEREGAVRRPQLGVATQSLTPALADAFQLPRAEGALVVRVTAGSAAQRGGLAPGDVVLVANGVAIRQPLDLVNVVGGQPERAPLLLQVSRAGRALALRVVPGPTPAPAPIDFRPVDMPWRDGMGLSLAELSPRLRAQAGVDTGVLVREVEGAARRDGVQRGDVIVGLNAEKVSGVDEFKRALARAAARPAVALLVVRERRTAYVPVQLR
ncbi:MAG: trypsin-like peptidase domain-containing protein [Bordetella sp.]|nr:trypsin-like peptidase domain-containing protein [Pseudomonadota bacterium]